jgi:uncharacterized protein YlzI (FlbEa/FlbD family)
MMLIRLTDKEDGTPILLNRDLILAVDPGEDVPGLEGTMGSSGVVVEMVNGTQITVSEEFETVAEIVRGD